MPYLPSLLQPRIVLLTASFTLLALVPPHLVIAQVDERTVDATTTESSDSETATTTTPTTSEPVLPQDTYSREQLPTDEVYSDFVVGPGRFELELAPGESQTVELLISNRMGDGRVFSFETEDMTGSSEGDSAVTLLGDTAGPYTLRDYISVPHDRFYLEHGERARVPVTVTMPPDAEPGGRYGSLLSSIVSNPNEIENDSGAQPASVVVSRIGTLFFVTTPGEVVRDAELARFSTVNEQTWFAQGPIDFLVTITNDGSVHTTPYGIISIRNLFGEDVGAIQMQPWFVMPNSTRTREVTWDRDFLFGYYTATLDLNRGYDDIIDTSTYSFWVIPWKLVAATFAGLFVLFLLVRAIFSRFEFKRRS